MKSIEELGISPAPWEEDHGFVISGGENVALTICDENGIGARESANARLIKAAPKLYDALYRIMSAADDSVLDVESWRKRLNEALDDARVALDYAAGESEVAK